MKTMARLFVPVIACFVLAAGHLFAQAGGQVENTSTACQDGVDNDGDTFADCKDQDCSVFVFCQQQEQPPAPAPTPPVVTNENTIELCRDFRDNDNDGYIDCNDQDCAIFSFCIKAGAGAGPGGAAAGVPKEPRKSKGGIGFYVPIVVFNRANLETREDIPYVYAKGKMESKMEPTSGIGIFGEALIARNFAIGGEILLVFPMTDETRVKIEGDDWGDWYGCPTCNTHVLFSAMVRLKFPIPVGKWVALYPLLSLGLTSITRRIEDVDDLRYVGLMYTPGFGVEIRTPIFLTPFIDIRYDGGIAWGNDIEEPELLGEKIDEMLTFHSVVLNIGLRFL